MFYFTNDLHLQMPGSTAFRKYLARSLVPKVLHLEGVLPPRYLDVGFVQHKNFKQCILSHF